MNAALMRPMTVVRSPLSGRDVYNMPAGGTPERIAIRGTFEDAGGTLDVSGADRSTVVREWVVMTEFDVQAGDVLEVDGEAYAPTVPPQTGDGFGTAHTEIRVRKVSG